MVPPQKSVEDMIYFSEFMAKRIVYLKRKYGEGTLIKLKDDFLENMSHKEIIKRFKDYIEEMEDDPDWDRHFQYVRTKMTSSFL